MARLFVAIGGLIVLALTAALVAPYFVDWTSYRADFEREAGRILGREVTVRGSATARLLPFPSVSFTDVAVAGTAPGETAMTVETFSMDAELAPFMRGDVHIFDMRLVRPAVFVDLAADGALDWAMRPSVPVGASHISLERLTVTEGKVELRHAASGRIHRLTEINADISARALTGPWRVDGSLRLDGMRMALQASTGQADGEGGMRLRVQARPERYALALETDGNARIEDGRALYSGGFRLNAPVAPVAAEPRAAGLPAERDVRARPCRACGRAIPLRDRLAAGPLRRRGQRLLRSGYGAALSHPRRRRADPLRRRGGRGRWRGGRPLRPAPAAGGAARIPARRAAPDHSRPHRDAAAGRGGGRHHGARRASLRRAFPVGLERRLARRDAAGPRHAGGQG
ncbi:MAG TPA: hypothetical protein PL183_09055 [Aquamicrobium sp.]|nr:hypothetical protein [Aquamicrobium sp.]